MTRTVLKLRLAVARALAARVARAAPRAGFPLDDTALEGQIAAASCSVRPFVGFVTICGQVLFGPIPSKNTFVHFSKSEPKEIQRSSSSPGQLQSLCVARDGPTFFARGDVSSAEPVAGTCAHGSETKQKEGLKTQKLLNRELVLAASGPDAALQAHLQT